MLNVYLGKWSGSYSIIATIMITVIIATETVQKETITLIIIALEAAQGRAGHPQHHPPHINAPQRV